MAWQTGVGKHQHRKEASAAKRSEERRAAIEAASDEVVRRRRGHRVKPFGLKMHYRSILIGRRLAVLTEWYETEKDRDKAEAAARKRLVAGKPRFELIEQVER